MLKNGLPPVPINRRYLGNDNCMALLLSGHAVALPPMVNDIADALYWLQEIDSPVPLRCTYDIVAKNLLRVCINDDEHIHPYEAHSWLAIFATFILLRTYFSLDDSTSLASARAYLEACWGNRLSVNPFKIVLLDAYENLIGTLM
jgi:hypothetical protein